MDDVEDYRQECPACSANEPHEHRRKVRKHAIVIDFRWASVTGMHGMVTAEEAEWLGYTKVREHPRFPGSWLMRRDG